MVDAESTLALAALANSMASPSMQRKPTRMDNSLNPSREARTTVGWISRKNLALRSRGEFFLDIPFYRTH